MGLNEKLIREHDFYTAYRELENPDNIRQFFSEYVSYLEKCGIENPLKEAYGNFLYVAKGSYNHPDFIRWDNALSKEKLYKEGKRLYTKP